MDRVRASVPALGLPLYLVLPWEPSLGGQVADAVPAAVRTRASESSPAAAIRLLDVTACMTD
ncbi:hypothetical protein ABT404_02105 [Streptomyces hyaluromycini]|uniref:Uncharacterized protein n=1 Tax=Streptomyces hyaluromycini TaxID=1377993 RepID=A0ABV1WN56_9ACTN